MLSTAPDAQVAQLVEQWTEKPSSPTLPQSRNSDCRDWTGCLDKDGYPSNKEHRRELARKLGRPIGSGLEAMHSCDNRACINPDHLSEGNHAQNIADRDGRGRTQRGGRHWKARLTEEKVIEIRRRASLNERLASIASDMGVGREAISKIVRGENWKHVSHLLGGAR